MMSQLEFMTSFVDDLLDLRQIREGVFSLSNEVFDPMITIKLICDTFGP